MNTHIETHEFTIKQEKAKELEVGDDIELRTPLEDASKSPDNKDSLIKTFKVLEIKFERKEGGVVIATIDVADKKVYEQWCTEE